MPPTRRTRERCTSCRDWGEWLAGCSHYWFLGLSNLNHFLLLLFLAVVLYTDVKSYFPKAQFGSSATQAKSHLEHFDSHGVISREDSIWTGSYRIGRISVGWGDPGRGNTGQGKQSEHTGQKELGEEQIILYCWSMKSLYSMLQC